jgi:cytochrome c oxidase subunit 3
MFFAALFAMYFTIRSVSEGKGLEWSPALLPAGAQAAEGVAHLDIPFATANTIILVLSSVTCQLGVWAAEKGQVSRLRFWYIVSFLMGAVFIAGQLFEYAKLASEGATLSANAYTSVFYLTTGFHGLHVTGGLIAFLFMLGRTYAAKRFTHEQATSAIVVSYYWHFVDVVWIGLFATIYIIR